MIKEQVKRRNNARRYFLTISKYEIGKEKIRDLLVSNEEFLSHYIIGEENHTDGTKHYHIYLKYSKQREFSPLHFDYLGKHGRLEVCRSPIRSYMYISKEDKSPLANFDYEAGILKGTTEEIAVYMSQTGKKYSDLLMTEGRSALITKWRAIKGFEKELEEEDKLREILVKRTGIKQINDQLMKELLTELEYDLIKQSDGLKLIIEHLNKVMLYKGKKPFKDKHLLIWSRGVNKGKTSLIRKLMEYCPMYGFPTDQWFHGYKSNYFWGIFWNEMKLVGMDIDMLKNFFEGTPVKLNIKGSQVEKTDNPQMFMTSNNSLEEMIEKKYHTGSIEEKEIVLNALRARIDEVCVDAYKDIFFLMKLIVPIN